MFEYDKTLKKLSKFSELSDKKQKKVFNTIFLDEDFRNWFYNIDNNNSQPMTGPMINKLLIYLIEPECIKKLAKYVEYVDGDFDHTSISLVYLILDTAVDVANNDIREMNEKYQKGEIDAKIGKQCKERGEKYSEYITVLMEALDNRCSGEIKSIAKKSSLPKDLVKVTYYEVPGKKFIPKYKISMYVNQLLRRIYEYVGDNNLYEISSIDWNSYFSALFGEDMVPSVGINILIEGVRRIDIYREAKYFDKVREIWDSLTNFALEMLNNAPENTRKQMIEIYIKKIEKIFRGTKTPIRLRVDLLNLPNSFNNLTSTVNRYSNQISAITMQGINTFKNMNTNSNSNHASMNNTVKIPFDPATSLPVVSTETNYTSFSSLNKIDDETEDDGNDD